MTYSTPSQLRAARVMLTVLLLTGAAGISVQAESTGGDYSIKTAGGENAGADRDR